VIRQMRESWLIRHAPGPGPRCRDWSGKSIGTADGPGGYLDVMSLAGCAVFIGYVEFSLYIK
jgi:hypothetical protein